MKMKLTFAALALIAAGCSNQELTEAVQDGQDSNARVITLQAAMPETADEASATRATYEPDGASVSGVVMKWTADDQLKLCFKKGAAYYHKDATIVPSSISSDGKTAKFTWEMPTEIGAGDTFDFYAVYQRPYMDETYGGVFEAGTPNYQFEERENMNVTLDKKGTNYWRDGIINPVLLFSRTNVTTAQLGALKLDLAHTGWIMALHLTNASGTQMDLPKYISMQYPTEPASSFIWNGNQITNAVNMDVTTGTVTSYIPGWTGKAGIYFEVNESSSNPLYGEKLDNGATKVFYRWVVSTPQIEQMKVEMKLANDTSTDSTNRLPGRTVQNGKVYHVFLKWDGTALTLTKRDGTAY